MPNQSFILLAPFLVLGTACSQGVDSEAETAWNESTEVRAATPKTTAPAPAAKSDAGAELAVGPTRAEGLRLTFGAETVTVNGNAVAFPQRRSAEADAALAHALPAEAAAEGCRIVAQEGTSLARLYPVLEALSAKGTDRCVYEAGGSEVPLRCKSPRRLPDPAEMRTVTLPDGRKARTTAKPNETIVHLAFAADRVEVVHKRVVTIVARSTLPRPLSASALSKALRGDGVAAVVLHFAEPVLADQASADVLAVAAAHAALSEARQWKNDEWLLVGP